MEKGSWKILAIVFMAIFILESGFIFWIVKAGTVGEKNEIKCGILCDEEYSTPYYYDWYEEVCYCIEDGEEVYKEFMG